MSTDVAAELPYERGEILRSTADDVAKLRIAWQIVARRHADGTLFDFTGLVRSLALPEDAPLDDELAPALYGERLTEHGLEHLGGVAGRDDVFVANRTTAGLVAAMQVLVEPGAAVVGFSAGYSHPAVKRAVRLAGGTLVDVTDIDELRLDDAALLVLTRLAVTYEALDLETIERAISAARDAGVPVFVDDAGGARVGPAVLGQPKLLELGADAGVTGLDKYGTSGPRLGLMGGRAELIARIRARAIELGLEARPMLYPAVVESLERYRPERVRELVATTHELAEALVTRLGDWPARTPVAAKLEGEDVLAELERRGADPNGLVPVEATAGLAMLLLRDHGILTVHFAALPPGTSALLLKFVPPETLARFGGAGRFADAVAASLDELARAVGAGELPQLLGR
jgi:L-seryl-tRNA(Ser) seleniumtransferase